MIIFVWRILKGLVPNLFSHICTKALDRRWRTCITSNINVEHWSITDLDGVPLIWLSNYIFT